ncbi:MAG: hypothetical protein GY864_04900 [Desulfobacterales bacterium]|nr:hypothetical protein [Desulfobacterales bacterium]
MKRLIRPFLVFLWISGFGCTHVPERDRPPIDEVTTPLFPMDMLDKRISSLEGIQNAQGISEYDKKIASDLLRVYESLKDIYSDHLSEDEYRSTIYDLFLYLNLMEQNYFSQKLDMTHYSEAVTHFVEKRNDILDAYLSGDYRDVADQCLELKKDFGPDARTPGIGLLFALSLAKEGMFEDAISIGDEIVYELEASPDLIYLRVRMAEWQLRLGREEKASRIYDKLEDDLGEKGALLKGLDKKIIKESGSHITINEGPVVLGPLDELLKEVDALARSHAFDEARGLLIRYGIMAEERTEIGIINQALKDLKSAKEEFEAEEISRNLFEQETLKSVKELIEKENYQEAIVKLEELEQAQGLNTETGELKERTIEKYINRERNQAAQLFLAARKTRDPIKKEEYLLSSLEILTTLIDKYPSSPLYGKLKSHRKRVDEELNNLNRN